MTVFVTWHSPVAYDERTQDAAWFVRHDSTHSLVATVTDDETDLSVSIFVDGEMAVAVHPDEDAARADRDLLGYVFAGDGFAEYGITDDTELAAERLVWSLNAWFDIYEDGEQVDAVEHTIDNAVAQAKAILAEVRTAMDEQLRTPGR